MAKCKSPAPSGYDVEEYEHINTLLSNSDFDLSIEALCKCFRNPSERNRFVEYKKFGNNKKMPLRTLGVLYKNSVWTTLAVKYTPISNLIYRLIIEEPCIVDLNKHLIIGTPLTPYNYTAEDEKYLSLKEGTTLLEVLYEKYKDEDEGNCINKEEGTGRVKYSKIIDGDEYKIIFKFYVVEGRCNVSIMITCPAIFKIVQSEEEVVRKEKERIEEEMQRRKEERKRKEEEARRRMEEEARRRMEEEKRKYRNDLSNLL